MKFNIKKVPRIFSPKKDNSINISDFGDIFLNPNEQISFVTSTGKRHDFVAKDWGFYSTPSINSRLKIEGFKTALVKNAVGQIYIMTIEVDKLDFFQKYCEIEKQFVIEWLDERQLDYE
jgi:hypothetical protein